jgi:serine/threonine protein kinase
MEQNVLVVSHAPQAWWIKIADFGISKRLEEDGNTSTAVIGTWSFMAPEMLFSGRYRTANPVSPRDPFKGDIWAVGCITYYVLTKNPPFRDIDAIMDYAQGEATCPILALPDTVVSHVGQEFMLALLDIDSEKRPSAKNSQRHEWLKDVACEILVDDVQDNRYVYCYATTGIILICYQSMQLSR